MASCCRRRSSRSASWRSSRRPAVHATYDGPRGPARPARRPWPHCWSSRTSPTCWCSGSVYLVGPGLGTTASRGRRAERGRRSPARGVGNPAGDGGLDGPARHVAGGGLRCDVPVPTPRRRGGGVRGQPVRRRPVRRHQRVLAHQRSCAADRPARRRRRPRAADGTPPSTALVATVGLRHRLGRDGQGATGCTTSSSWSSPSPWAPACSRRAGVSCRGSRPSPCARRPW